MIYGVSFKTLVASYPQGIFFVSFAAVTLAVISLFFVELPHGKDHDCAEAERVA